MSGNIKGLLEVLLEPQVEQALMFFFVFEAFLLEVQRVGTSFFSGFILFYGEIKGKKENLERERERDECCGEVVKGINFCGGKDTF